MVFDELSCFRAETWAGFSVAPFEFVVDAPLEDFDWVAEVSFLGEGLNFLRLTVCVDILALARCQPSKIRRYWLQFAELRGTKADLLIISKFFERMITDGQNSAGSMGGETSSHELANPIHPILELVWMPRAQAVLSHGAEVAIYT